MKTNSPSLKRFAQWFCGFIALIGLFYVVPKVFTKTGKDAGALFSLIYGNFNADDEGLAGVDINKLIAEWGNCNFEKPTSNSINQIIDSSNTKFSGKVRLTDEQRTAYVDFVLNMFTAFSSGDYSLYKAWRFSAATVPRREFIDDVRTTIVNGYRIPPNGIYVRNKDLSDKVNSLLVAKAPTDPEMIFEHFVRLQSLGEYYTNFWKGFCISNIQLQFDAMTRSLPDVDQYKFNFMEGAGANPHSAKAGFSNIGLAIHPGFFTFKESPEIIVKQTGKVLVAHALIMVDMGDGRGSGPVVTQAYWAPNARRWLPSAIAEGNLWQIRGVQLCF